MPPLDPLDVLLAPESQAPAAQAFRGLIAHLLLFYKQNHLKDKEELLAIGRDFKITRKLSTNFARAKSVDKKDDPCVALCERGLLSLERYWGSLRLSEKAVTDFRRASELAPESPWPWFLLGMALEMRRRYAEGIRALDRAIALRPKWAWPLIIRGICLWYLAEFEAAKSDFEKAARLDPASELPLLFLGRVKADLRDRTLIKDLDRALALAPRSGFALSWRGRAFFVMNRTPKALVDLKRSIEALPDYDRGWSWLGVSYVELGRFEEAIPLLEKAAELNPYYPTTLYPLARALGKVGRWDEAGKRLEAAAAIDRHGVWVEHRISMSHPNPACLRSVGDLSSFIERRPRAAWAWAWRGQTELLLRNYAKALSDLDRSLALDPSDAWARTWKGEALRRLGRCREAVAELDRALRADASLTFARAARGYCLLFQGNHAAAEAELSRSLSAQPRCGPALAWRAEARFRLGRHQAAISDWERALEIHPRDAWIRRWLWRARARLGDWEGALSEAEKMVDRSAETRALRGWLAGKAGLDDEAARELAAALKIDERQPLALAESARLMGRLGKAKAEAPLSLADIEGFLFRFDPRAQVLPPAEDEVSEVDAPGLLARGWKRLEGGECESAVEDASRALDHALDPDRPGALWLRAQAKSRAGDLKAAKEDLARLERLYALV